ncbi:unnamed protein product [Calicophoron daubneyi]|uniref:Transmembrane protein n=1 Tax=Calicophoron daubneyi TaxID=300641 RepID=A0AAV2TL83_CALDB
MSKRRSREEKAWKEDYGVIKKESHRHSRHHSGTQTPAQHIRYYKSETDTTTESSEVEYQETFVWHQIWFAGLLILLFPFSIFGMISLVLLCTAYTDYCCGLVDSYKWKISRSKYLMITAYFILFLLLSLIIIITVLARYNLVNTDRMFNQIFLLKCLKRN